MVAVIGMFLVFALAAFGAYVLLSRMFRSIARTFGRAGRWVAEWFRSIGIRREFKRYARERQALDMQGQMAAYLQEKASSERMMVEFMRDMVTRRDEIAPTNLDEFERDPGKTGAWRAPN